VLVENDVVELVGGVDVVEVELVGRRVLDVVLEVELELVDVLELVDTVALVDDVIVVEGVDVVDVVTRRVVDDVGRDAVVVVVDVVAQIVEVDVDVGTVVELLAVVVEVDGVGTGRVIRQPWPEVTAIIEPSTAKRLRMVRVSGEAAVAPTAVMARVATRMVPVGEVRELVWKKERLTDPAVAVFAIGAAENSPVPPPTPSTRSA